MIEPLTYYQAESLLKLCIAFILGAILGLEREIKRHPAGLRTHILVTVGSTGFMLAGISLMNSLGTIADPSRIAQGIVTGVGFLGGGAIIKAGVDVKGLTTAASIWIASAVGLLVATNAFMIAVGITIIALITLCVIQKMEIQMKTRTSHSTLIVKGKAGSTLHTIIRQHLNSLGVQVEEMGFSRSGNVVTLHLILTIPYNMENTTIIESLGNLPEVIEAFWE